LHYVLRILIYIKLKRASSLQLLHPLQCPWFYAVDEKMTLQQKYLSKQNGDNPQKLI
jgi:hypothetical protein